MCCHYVTITCPPSLRNTPYVWPCSVTTGDSPQALKKQATRESVILNKSTMSRKTASSSTYAKIPYYVTTKEILMKNILKKIVLKTSCNVLRRLLEKMRRKICSLLWHDLFYYFRKVLQLLNFTWMIFSQSSVYP